MISKSIIFWIITFNVGLFFSLNIKIITAKSISLAFLQFSEILLGVNTGDSESGFQQVPLRMLGGIVFKNLLEMSNISSVIQ